MKEHTTIQIYRDDLQILNNNTRKNENLRDVLHEVITEYFKILKEQEVSNDRGN